MAENVRFLKFVLLVGISFFAVSCKRTTESASDVFNRLNGQLMRNLPNAPTITEFSRSEIFAMELGHYDRQLFSVMARQNSLPLVAMAGVVALQDRYPDDAFDAAMNAWSSAEDPANTCFGLMTKYFEMVKPPEGTRFIDQFESLCSKIHSNQAGFILLIHALSTSSLKAWLQAKPEGRLLANECLVVDRLYGEYLDSPERVPEWMREKLQSYSNLEGPPHAIYIYYADIPGSQLKPKLIDVLEDEDLEEWQIMAVTNKFREIINREIDISSLHISVERQRLLNRILQKR